MRFNRSHSRFGFTLVELIIVLAIIGLIAGIIGVSATKSRSLARDTVRAADLSTIQNALNLYFADNKRYPATTAALTPTYLSQIPTDPLTGSSYVYAALDTNGVASTCDSYHLGAVTENAGFVGLSQDRDAPQGTACTGSSADFNGNAASCSGAGAASPDACFDLAP